MSVTDPDPNPNPEVDPITGEPIQANPDPNAPDPNAPKQDDPVTAARIDAAKSEARADAFKEALTLAGQKQDPATPAQVQAPIPTDPMQTFTAAEREELKTLQITDPDKAMGIISQRASQLAERRIQQEAQPLVATTASTLVELFIARKSRGLNPQVADQIIPLFQAKLKGKNLSGLVQMTDALREEELGLRWDAAEAEVLRKAQANPPKQEPRLLANGQPGTAATGLKKSAIEDDPFLAAMSAEYKFTDAQKKELEAFTV